MFEPVTGPRLFGMAPGVDFPNALVSGLVARMDGRPPEDMARIQVLVNTARMARRIKTLFAQRGAFLLPRITLLGDLGTLLPGVAVPPPISPLQRQLDLADLVRHLIASDPGIAPKAAVFDLAKSLAALMDEMQGEGVGPEALLSLDVSDHSGHWARSLNFLQITRSYLDAAGDNGSDPEARQRVITNMLIARWATNPPTHPVIVAGSTGSRGTTALLMKTIAQLPQGAVVLPGFDFDLQPPIWEALMSESAREDHPQYRFARLMRDFAIKQDAIISWTGDPPCSERNTLISLALRPAPVTSQWRQDGPLLGHLSTATDGMSLIEASSPREEAQAIALCLRKAVADGVTAALISPDRTLARRVSAALDRWEIEPDDSAGKPLSLSPPGRFLRHAGGLLGKDASGEAIIELLKHPLAHSGAERGQHLLLTREFELFLRKRRQPLVTLDDLATFSDLADGRQLWCDWITDCLTTAGPAKDQSLGDHLKRHVVLAESLAAGSAEGMPDELWNKAAGREAAATLDRLSECGDHPSDLTQNEYLSLFEQVLSEGTVRDRDSGRPDVMIWGTLEARVQGADFVILGGLNDGVWPERPSPDPWLNRQMRRSAGLLLPDRRIGLSAHDFQQAVGAKTVVLSRSKRDSDSETVPSRWLNRLMNLLEGLPDQGGPDALKRMRERGAAVLDAAANLDHPHEETGRAARPAPAPPPKARPMQLSVTQIRTLIRDPYAIYARRVLNLKPLDPLVPEPSAALRGIVVHKVMEKFAENYPGSDAADAYLRGLIDGLLHDLVPWPATRALWRGRFLNILPFVLSNEAGRRLVSQNLAIEAKGSFPVPGTKVTLVGTADRIDRLADGTLEILDYKTGSPPSIKEVRFFDRQLLIEAVMAEADAFNDLPAGTVGSVMHIGLGSKPVVAPIPMMETVDQDFRTVTVLAELTDLLASYEVQEQGYISRRAMEKVRFEGDYDHLARFGEWDETMSATTGPVG